MIFPPLPDRKTRLGRDNDGFLTSSANVTCVATKEGRELGSLHVMV